MWIDVGKLIREHVPDKNGNPLPQDLISGSYEIRDLVNHGVGTLFEGKIIYDDQNKEPKMSFSLARHSTLFHALLISPLWLLLTTQQTREQAAFEQAQQLIEQWADIQNQQIQDQKLSDAALNNLRQITNTIARQVPGLLRKGTLELLNSPGGHSPQELRQRIFAALHDVPSTDYEPEVYVFQIETGRQPSFLLAYSVPYCASCSRAWIGVAGSEAGHYEILSEEDSSFDNKSLHVTPLAAGDGGKDRFLVYGTNWGDAHNRLSVVAYVVADGKLERFWERTDLPQGSIKTAGTQITLTFLTALTPPWNERTDVYKVEPENQIKLVSSSEHPE